MASPKRKDLPKIEFLFRFRDLVAPTIDEHQKLISSEGWCWWGWWKRPSEDRRTDIWEDLHTKIGKEGSAKIGLFDSGSGVVHLATVEKVIPPSDEAEDTIKLGEDDAKHVPGYYRESPFSRAWLKLISIEKISGDFFNSYSFAEAPKLPNYSDASLRRFKDKKIENPDELRGMDTTIWRVRLSQPSDHAGVIILTVPALPDAVSTDIVSCKSDLILHLTDLHFATGKNRAQHVWRYDSDLTATQHTMVEAITAALSSTGKKPGLVVITGDFTFLGSEEEFNEARTAITHLLGILDLSTDNLTLVPGNHDIQWATDEVYSYDAQVIQAPPVARQNYEKFYRDLMRHEPDRHLAMGRRFGLPAGLIVEICGLNSSSLQTGKSFLAGMGRVDESAFIDTATALHWDNDKTFALRLLVLHHHLVQTEDIEPANGYGQGYGMAVDAPRIQRMAAQKGVHLALHGHKHRAFIWRSDVYELPEHAQSSHERGRLSIVGGGSAGSSETEGHSNYFNLIEIKPGALELAIYRSKQNGAFQDFQRWNADLRIEKGSLRLGEWYQV